VHLREDEAKEKTATAAKKLKEAEGRERLPSVYIAPTA
jgi:hypothetical protein